MSSEKEIIAACLPRGIPLNPLPPPNPTLSTDVDHAPVRSVPFKNDPEEMRLALRNALRYFPEELHETLAPEFLKELEERGHIYMYRFRPVEYEMKARPIDMYPAKCAQAAAIMMMIQNNLDPRVAQYPHELVTYGGNGCVFQNWAQYHLVMKYLSEMNDEQTLVMMSGHPLGLFPSHRDAPRVVVTNGMVVPHYSSKDEFDKFYAQGVTMYGQMTAGSYCYIGPQGIVHGTTITLLNAGRKYLGHRNSDDMKGVLFVTSGLGGMSGAQAKAAVICGCIAVIAEVNEKAIMKRYNQGWVMEIVKDIDSCIVAIRRAKREKKPLSIAYHGNVVDLWERLAKETDIQVELGSDQTSLHNPYNGGYYPVGLSFDEANEMMKKDPVQFKKCVQESLRRHVAAINILTARGMKFWDYGNSFLLEAGRAGADIFAKPNVFKYPSYIEDIMGDIFSLGFGPFRWVCTSNDPKDLEETDKIAAEVIDKLRKDAPPKTKQQYDDNYLWITKAGENKLVVGSQARILYSDALGRQMIAREFNKAIKEKRISRPIVMSRDHHDVSGADSPWRETSNVTDGSKFTADMTVQTIIGDAFRGATWVSIHNGGGTGWGEAINGGFGMVLDGTNDADRRANMMLFWDVNNGISRRAWAGNQNALETIERAMKLEPNLKVTMPIFAKDDLLNKLIPNN